MVDTDIEDIIRHSIERSSKMIKLWQRYKPFINAGVQELITYESILFFIGLGMSWEPLWPFISGRQSLILPMSL